MKRILALCAAAATALSAQTFTGLYSFDVADGAYPQAAPIQATDGNFYGTTSGGGTGVCSLTNGCGTIFRITPGGALTTLYNFCSQTGCADGSGPAAGLVQAAGGYLYGTTYSGGAHNGGTVFKITPSGTLTTIYSFCSQLGCADGKESSATLIQGTSGDFYGTTQSGGAYGNYGTVFKITATGALTTLSSFTGSATNGNLYGTTQGGGVDNDGAVFSLSVGLGPFAETLPTSGEVGFVVKILGTDLTGATTGAVQVVTPAGTLSSNLPFRVL